MTKMILNHNDSNNHNKDNNDDKKKRIQSGKYCQVVMLSGN